MANEVKYENVDWAEGTPIAGERLATNGYYTGEHKGTPMQGKDETIAKHMVEDATIRLGTMLGDAADEEFPEIVTEEDAES